MNEYKKKVRNPLLKRIPRELLGDWRKYLVVSLFLILTIGFVSGMYVANESMMTAAEEGISKYKLEDGHFELNHQADEELFLEIESGKLNDFDSEAVPVQVYENFYKNEEEDNNNDGVPDGTVRVFAKTEEVNMACLMEGSFPEEEDEIAIDRMHADNAGIKVGDSITVGGQSYKVVGLIAYVNYATLHEKNTDLIFDALKFDVAMVTDNGFNRLSQNIHYTYAWKYEKETKDEKEEKSYSDDFLKVLFTQTIVGDNEIEDYIPRYANSAINFATNDMGSDEAMGGVLLDILIVIIAFIFAVIFKMMHHTPLQFLRHDLKKMKHRKAMRLPGWKFFNRFRLRIIFRNIPNYVILFAGIFFIMVMLAMAVGMPDTLKFYKENAADMMFAKYQYVLKSCVDEKGNVLRTENDTAERFSMRSLQKKNDTLDEEVSVYGISDDSRYVGIARLKSLKEDEVYISESFRDKYSLKEGDILSLDEKYENRQYQFRVVGTYDKCQNITIFMPIQNYRVVFDLKEGEFDGYMSDSEITDIGEENIATVITERDITKMCDQLDHSMGAHMQYFQFLCILLSAVLIYLLTKIIVEKNENAISMTKILGYENREIANLYLLSTTMILIIVEAVSVPLGALVMKVAWREIMFSYSGWFAYIIEPAGYVKMFAFVLIGYLFVMFFDFRRIKKIPMDQALKEQ